MASPITTHILDTAQGRPAGGVNVELERREGDRWQSIARGQTNDDWRIRDLLPEGSLQAGTYRITFATGEYFRMQGLQGFYPEVTVAFEVREPDQHYHVPLLLSPYGYSTYRGS